MALNTLSKITSVRRMIDHVNPRCDLEVDGGIDSATAPLTVTAGANVLVVARGDDEIFVPFAEPICLRVDPADRVIVIDPPDGLLELNEI